MLVDMATPKWSIYLVNDAWQRVTGISQEMAMGSHFWDLFEPPLPAQVCFAVLCHDASFVICYSLHVSVM